MSYILKISLLLAFCSGAVALESSDQLAVEKIIQNYTDAWNTQGCKGFANDFAENADFVNIFGMKISGKAQIEQRHIAIMESFLKDSKLEILNSELREVQPGLIIASIYWKLDGYRAPGSDLSLSGETQKGIFTQVFVHSSKKWEITASQNTLMR